MTTSLLSLLQAVAGLLALVQANPSVLPLATQQQALVVATNAVAYIARQATMPVEPPTMMTLPPPVMTGDITSSSLAVDANEEKVHSTQFFLPNREWVHADVPASDGSVLTVFDAYTSFGYLDTDVYNDAVAVVRVAKPNTAPSYYLATLVNNSGILAQTDLDSLPTFQGIGTHRVSPGSFTIELQMPGTETRRTFTYTYATGTLTLAQ